MNVLIVCTTDIGAYPPIQNLIGNLIENHHKVTVISRDDYHVMSGFTDCVHFIPLYKCDDKSAVLQMYKRLKKSVSLKKLVVREMEHNDVLWTTTDTTACMLGNLIGKYKTVMQLMELIEDVPLYGDKFPFSFHIDRLARKAWKVVVPEYNRAHIQKAIWKLDKLPCVLPNKPYDIQIPLLPEALIPIVQKMKREQRKIVLYQGVFCEDRHLDAFAEAIQKNSERFCLYIMGKDNKMREELCKKYPEIVYIPYVVAPGHLAITRYADIGIMPYIPEKVRHYSELNALYCAPNKIFEYAKFGLPMVGSDVPGIYHIFNRYNIGRCCNILDAQDITRALDEVYSSCEEMSNNCRNFFESVDLDYIVNQEILEVKGDVNL